MAKSAGYYNLDDFNRYKRSQGKVLPPRINVLAAASHVQAIFDAKKFTYGFVGGLPMLCLGYKREMPDLHVVYDAKAFERLKAKLESNRRVQLQLGLNPLLPFKILIWTGPSYGDYGCTVDATIELDLIPSGSCGSPTAELLSRSLIVLGLQTGSGKQMVFQSLNARYLVATLLSYCNSRDLLWDPRKDILYLCKFEGEEVRRIREQLDKKQVKELFLGTSFFSRLDVDTQRICYRTLLDTEPPPTMSITPPATRPQSRPQKKLDESDKNIDVTAPRSRYRKVANQGSSSDGTINHHLKAQLQPQSPTHLQDLRRLSRIEGLQCVSFAKPHAVSIPAATRNARKSMPNLPAAQHTPQLLSHEVRNNDGVRMQEQFRIQEASSSQQNVQTNSKLDYGAHFQPAYSMPNNDSRSTIQAPNPGQRMSVRKVPSTMAESTVIAVPGIQSQRGSLHTAIPDREQERRQQHFNDVTALRHGELHLVGPEGVYGTVEKPRKTGQVQSERQKHHSAPSPKTQPPLIFELDATVTTNDVFIAELPADSIVATSAEQQATRGDAALPNKTMSRPTNIRASSAPLGGGSLPASLQAGRPETHPQGQRSEHSTMEQPASFSSHQTNAFRYSTYAAPSAVTLDVSPGEIASAYKAYRPFVVTTELNRTDSVTSIYSPRHKRDASDDSTASHDSLKLAREYQELLDLDKEYGRFCELETLSLA